MKIKFMKAALKEAKKAAIKDEVPIGAVIVVGDKIIARAHNQTETKKLAIAHAEILALIKASKKFASWRIENAEMYVTLEPCLMCAGAIARARINKVYFGAYENKAKYDVGNFDIINSGGFNHTVTFEGGIMEEECSNILKDYFKNKRANNHCNQHKEQ